MEFEYLAQDDENVIDEMKLHEGKKYKDPIEITIKITVERTRYNSVKNRYKTPIAQKIKDMFKACK